ncbi:ankyrin [Viridothelium virens]|uniref:Ankyrin n=1 Tax=Viridothelium virens TaxID=1048519 RepID=A0A6A6HEJ4_VIRVR|nr:ankyrin [Viridothelium virens]
MDQSREVFRIPARPWTYRVENIPARTTREELLKFFLEPDHKYITIKSLAPAAASSDESDASDLTATLSFATVDGPNRMPRLAVTSSSRLTVDNDFYGLTPLNWPQRPVKADIIAITGLAGHAYGSWATRDNFMWLRDALPLDIPCARILIYGYPSHLQNNEARNILADYAQTFIERIRVMKEVARGSKDRPIILIGHSLGCLIIKQALVEAFGSHSSLFPICCIIFLGAPHRGLQVEALETLVKSKPAEDIIRELKSGSSTLRYLNKSFCKATRGIPIITCYERYPTPTVVWRDGDWRRDGPKVLMVPESSAILDLPQETLIAAHSNHSDIAKIKRNEGGIYHILKGKIENAIRQTRPIIREIFSSIGNEGSQIASLTNATELVQLWPDPGPEAQYTEADTRLDIIAIHGLAGNYLATWIDGSRLWLRDFLPSQVKEARVLSFSYSATNVLACYGSGLEDQAIHLLAKLKKARMNLTQKSRRKLLFVCHDFGGMILKQALLLTHQPESTNHWFYESTMGTLFFGSPQHGPDSIWWSNIIRRLLREHYAVLSNITSDLAGIGVKFGLVCDRIVSSKLVPGRIYSFYESLSDVSSDKILDEQSAILKAQNETVVALDADHQGLCKFISSSHVNYSLVINSIKDIIDYDEEEAAPGLRMVEMKFLDYLLRVVPNSILYLIPNRWERSCDWILEHAAFRKLQHDDNSRLLWLHGTPGSGKTVLMKHVVQSMEDILCGRTSDAKLPITSVAGVSHCIAFFFCDDKDPLRKTVEGVLLSILYQILRNSATANINLFRHIDQDFLYDKGENQKSISGSQAHDDQEKLWSTLLAIAQKAPGIVFWIFIDAVDELKSGAMNELLLGMERTVNGDLVGRVKFILSSRSSVSEETHFSATLSPLQIDMNLAEGVHSDVQEFVHSRVDSFANAVPIDDDYRKRLVEELVRVSAGTFLHASLAWAAFTKGLAPEDPRLFMQKLHGLEQMPTDLESFYCGLLASISGPIRPLAKLGFSWVLASCQPLGLDELRYAVSIDYNNHTNVQEVNDTMNNMVPENFAEQCAFLIKVGNDGKVQFAHQSVKDLLLQRSVSTRKNETVLNMFRLSHQDSHSQIAKACLTTLLMDTFSLPSIDSEIPSGEEILNISQRILLTDMIDDQDRSEYDELRNRLTTLWRQSPLLLYSLQYWADHSAEATRDGRIDDLIFRYVTSPQANYFRLATMTWKRACIETVPDALGQIAATEPPIHMTLQCGDFSGVVRKLLSEGHNVNELDEVGLTPLHWAITRNCKQSFEVLLEVGELDPNQSPTNRPKPIHQAIYWQRTSFLSRLLDAKGIEVNSRSREYWTPLHLALHRRFISAIEVLLEDHRIDIQARDENGVSGFELAFRLGYRETIIKRMVQLIDMKSALRGASGSPELSLLMLAGVWGWTDVERQILEKDRSQVLELDNEGMNVLTKYAYWGRREKVKFFLQNLPAESLTYSYVGNRYNLLHLCAHQNWEDVVHTLRSKFRLEGLDSDHRGRTLLHWAAENRWKYAQADHSSMPPGWLDRQDRDGMTALHLAVINRNSVAVDSLLSQGARFLLRDKHGKNAVHTAAEQSFTPALRLFLATEVREFQRDHHGTTLLHYVCMWQSSEIIEQYIEYKKPRLNVRDKSRRTALHTAARCGNCDAAEVLLSRGAFVDARDSNLQTPLHYALSEGHKGMIKILERHSADFHLRDRFRQTCLHISIRQQRRISHRFDEENSTPVITRAIDDETVNKVMQKAPMIHYRDSFGKLPLHRASAVSTPSTVRKLIRLGAGLNLQDSFGQSSLHLSVGNNNHAVTKTLLACYNIQTSKLDHRGCTPLDYALTLGQEQDINVLLNVQAISTQDYGLRLRPLLNPYWHETDRYNWHTEWKICLRGGVLPSKPTYSPPTPTYSPPMPTYSPPTPTYSSPTPTYSPSTKLADLPPLSPIENPFILPERRDDFPQAKPFSGLYDLSKRWNYIDETYRVNHNPSNAQTLAESAFGARRDLTLYHVMIHKDDIYIPTLDIYDLPYRTNLEHPAYWIITQHLTEAQMDFLFQHVHNLHQLDSALPLDERQRKAVPANWQAYFPNASRLQQNNQSR